MEHKTVAGVKKVKLTPTPMATLTAEEWTPPAEPTSLEDDPVDEPPFTFEELKRLALAVGLPVLE